MESVTLSMTVFLRKKSIFIFWQVCNATYGIGLWMTERVDNTQKFLRPSWLVSACGQVFMLYKTTFPRPLNSNFLYSGSSCVSLNWPWLLVVSYSDDVFLGSCLAEPPGPPFGVELALVLDTADHDAQWEIFIIKIQKATSIHFSVGSWFLTLDFDDENSPLLTVMVVWVMVLPSNSVDMLTVYSVLSSKPSNRVLYLYMEAMVRPNSSSVDEVNEEVIELFLLEMSDLLS